MAERPEYITDKHLDFLDALRESGKTNMFGAVSYLKKKFKGMSEARATETLSYWMKTFSERHRETP